jgi:hypothetical protein
LALKPGVTVAEHGRGTGGATTSLGGDGGRWWQHGVRGKGMSGCSDGHHQQ